MPTLLEQMQYTYSNCLYQMWNMCIVERHKTSSCALAGILIIFVALEICSMSFCSVIDCPSKIPFLFSGHPTVKLKVLHLFFLICENWCLILDIFISQYGCLGYNHSSVSCIRIWQVIIFDKLDSYCKLTFDRFYWNRYIPGFKQITNIIDISNVI